MNDQPTQPSPAQRNSFVVCFVVHIAASGCWRLCSRSKWVCLPSSLSSLSVTSLIAGARLLTQQMKHLHSTVSWNSMRNTAVYGLSGKRPMSPLKSTAIYVLVCQTLLVGAFICSSREISACLDLSLKCLLWCIDLHQTVFVSEVVTISS